MQTYLITGANRGIGLEMTRQALELGLRVIATCRDPSSATELSALKGSLERADSDHVAYRSSKAAANMAMRTLALELEPLGIVVCMLHPGWVKTDMGGSNAALDVHESAAGLLEVIDGLTLQDTGRFLDYEGKTLPW